MRGEAQWSLFFFFPFFFEARAEPQWKTRQLCPSTALFNPQIPVSTFLGCQVVCAVS